MRRAGCRFIAVIALAAIGRSEVQSQKEDVRFTDISSSAGVNFRQINGASPSNVTQIEAKAA